MEREVLMTQEGLEELQRELKNLKEVKRVEVAEKIKVARDFGDLSENAEYDAARNEQSMMEGRITELEFKISHAKIIVNQQNDLDTISVGKTVLLHDIEFDEDVEYTLVGTTEADPAANKISNESPLGKALLGKKVGETVQYNAPGGKMEMKILDIRL